MRNAKGLVSIKLMRDRSTNEPQGFGFIDFATEEDAINALNGYNGRPIPGTGYTFRLNFGGGSRNISLADNYGLYIGELEANVTDAMLWQIFKEKYISFCGAKVMRETSGVSKGFGFIQFRARDEAERALREMNGYVINGRAIRLSYSSARNWNKDDGNATSSDASARYNVIMEGPEIPNIKPPPPTLAMIAKTLSNNTTGAAALVDAYGNAYENPMFAYDPVFQAAMQAKQREKMRRIQMGEEVDVNDVEVSNDRFKPFNVMEENRKYIQRVGAVFDLPSLTIPKVEVK